MSAELPVLTDLAQAEARHGDATVHRLDVAAVASKAELLDAIAAALSFPEPSGRNLDALFDRLRDLSWLPGQHLLVLTEPSALRAADPKAWRGIERTIADAVADNPRLHAVLLS